jgi:hypothetical protein
MFLDSVLNSAGDSERKLIMGRSIVIGLVVLLCLGAIAAPILDDARHWWPRKPKR